MFAVDAHAASDCNSGMGKGARSRLARKLRLLRAMKEWSQEDLAHACGLHRTHISLIERGACSVTLDNLEQLANSLDISLAELLDATEITVAGRRGNSTPEKMGRKKRGRGKC